MGPITTPETEGQKQLMPCSQDFSVVSHVGDIGTATELLKLQGAENSPRELVEMQIHSETVGLGWGFCTSISPHMMLMLLVHGSHSVFGLAFAVQHPKTPDFCLLKISWAK